MIRMEQKKEVAGRFFKEMLDNVHLLAIILDRNGLLIYCNDFFLLTTGFEREDILGCDWFSKVLPPDASENMREQFARFIENGTFPSSSENTVLIRSGEQRLIHWNNTLLKDEHGDVAGSASIGQDITTSRQAEARESEIRESLRSSEEKYRVLADHAQDWEYWMGTEGKFIYVSPACREVTGYRAEDFLDDPGLMHRLIIPEDAGIYDQHLNHILHQDAHEDDVVEFRIMDLDGNIHWIEHACHPIFRDDGTWLGRRGLNRDITWRKESEQQLHLTASVFENAREAILLTDAKERIVAVNPAFTEVTGYSADEVMGQTPKLLESGRHGPEFFAQMWKQVNLYGSWQGELWNRRKDGSLYPTLLVLTTVLDHKGEVTHYIGISTDTSRQKESEEQISHMADYDALTDLPNRALLRDRAERAMAMADRDSTELAILFVDVDRLKTINDSLGHAVGDKLLQTLAMRLMAEIREVDTVGRLGGDEFLLILPRTDANGAVLLARRLMTCVALPFEIEDHTLNVTPSIGICIYPRDGKGFDELLKAADIATGKAKESGRNTYQFFSPAMNEAAFERLMIENALRHALSRDEFMLYYQPQVNARTGNVIGYEALIRWKHPEMGMIPPLKFIPLAEETGLIVPIGTWVLREACRQAKSWQDEGLPPVRIAVNFSSRQFTAVDVLRTIEQALQDSGLEPDYLEVEITESLLMQNPQQTLKILHAIKSIGIHISIDDFGTGYSSLSYLKQFPIDKLKIDQSFVRNITHDPNDASIVRAIIALARSMQLATIAEGVETEAQFTYLRSLHCDEIQGYLFSPPVPPTEIPALKPGYLVAGSGNDSGATLLLVDDEENVLSSLKRLLRGEGYRILTAGSGEEGLELLARNEVRVVLSDQRMDGMSGTEFMTRVRTMHPNAVRMILSGHSDINSITGAINKGEIYKFITKPWDNTQLIATIREAFDRYEQNLTKQP